MPYNPQYLVDLNAIIADIEANRINGSGQAIAKFQIFVAQVKQIGRYNVADWRDDFTLRIYEFGHSFKTADPTEFLAIIEAEILNSNIAEKELLYFLKSEILSNFDKLQKQETDLINLLNQYVTNAEFYHTLGHIKVEKKEFIEALDCYSQSTRINSCQRFIETKFGAEVQYVDYLIENEKYDEAEIFVNERVSNNIYKANFTFHNWFILLSNRINDYKLLEKKALKKELELKQMLNNEFQSERRKVIELLGLFTAIIAFIFTTVSVAKTFEYEQAINFTTCLGLVLIDFAITISLIFHEKYIPIYKDIRLYVALIITTILYLILSTTTLITECFKQIN
jgi:tetratricopeptide (TPR) repeat protein